MSYKKDIAHNIKKKKTIIRNENEYHSHNGTIAKHTGAPNKKQ